jgi:tRNA1Val (adenine37-N6)-methyltransferase
MRVERTRDIVAGLKLVQPAVGYRASLDPVLLYGFIRPRGQERIVELGAGCGLPALLIARRWPRCRLWAIELQPELAAAARENARRNGLSRRCAILEGDLRRIGALLPARGFERVVANPPFRRPRSGRISPLAGRALARQELTFTLADMIGAADYLLNNGGRLDFIHLVERLPEILGALAEAGFEAKVMRLVTSFADRAPKLVLLSAYKRACPGLKVLPNLVVFDRPGVYTSEVRGFLQEAKGTGLSDLPAGC